MNIYFEENYGNYLRDCKGSPIQLMVNGTISFGFLKRHAHNNSSNGVFFKFRTILFKYYQIWCNEIRTMTNVLNRFITKKLHGRSWNRKHRWSMLPCSNLASETTNAWNIVVGDIDMSFRYHNPRINFFIIIDIENFGWMFAFYVKPYVDVAINFLSIVIGIIAVCVLCSFFLVHSYIYLYKTEFPKDLRVSNFSCKYIIIQLQIPFIAELEFLVFFL